MDNHDLRALEDWKTLNEEGIREKCLLALRRDAAKKKKDWFTDSGVPIWEEKGDNVVYSELKPTQSSTNVLAAAAPPPKGEPKKEISCASLNRLVEYLTSEKEHGTRR